MMKFSDYVRDDCDNYIKFVDYHSTAVIEIVKHLYPDWMTDEPLDTVIWMLLGKRVTPSKELYLSVERDITPVMQHIIEHNTRVIKVETQNGIKDIIVSDI